MHPSVHHWHSPALGQDMTLHAYGDRGKPALIFPAQEGRYNEYEDFGMVDAVRPFIDSGQLRLYCVDSVDKQSWCNQGIPPPQRAVRHNAYERYLLDEVVPFIHQQANGQKLLVSGCSMGGYHAANFYFRHPDVADSVISLSGVYDLQLFIGDAMSEEIFYHVPLAYLPGLSDPWFLEQYRTGHIVLCVGQGDWEEPMLTNTRAMAHILSQKNIPACIDIWGHDVSHDWPWWRQQMPYFLRRLL